MLPWIKNIYSYCFAICRNVQTGQFRIKMRDTYLYIYVYLHFEKNAHSQENRTAKKKTQTTSWKKMESKTWHWNGANIFHGISFSYLNWLMCMHVAYKDHMNILMWNFFCTGGQFKLNNLWCLSIFHVIIIHKFFSRTPPMTLTSKSFYIDCNTSCSVHYRLYHMQIHEIQCDITFSRQDSWLDIAKNFQLSNFWLHLYTDQLLYLEHVEACMRSTLLCELPRWKLYCGTALW